MKNRVFLIVTISVTLLILLGVPVLASTTTVQIPASGWDNLGGQNSSATWSRLGQRMMADDWQVISLGFRVCRVGNPQGDITISIRDSATDRIIVSKVWGNTSALADEGCSGYTQVTFDRAVTVDGDVRFCIEFYGGNATDYCQIGYFTGDRITGQWYTNYANYCTDVDGWHDIGEAEESSCCYTYTSEADPPPPDEDGVTEDPNIRVALIAGAVVCVAGITYLMRDKRRNT